jgi:glutamate-1-semialdehyde 2,1-aminomutase
VFYDGKPGTLEIPDGFTRFVRDITSELGILMVMDEVISFRVGYSGYQSLCDVEPDLTTFGKVIGGGLPVGALGGACGAHGSAR